MNVASGAGAATTVTVSGTVRNSAGEPVPNVLLISNWATLTGGSSDTAGDFSFTIDPANTGLDLIALFDGNGDPALCCTEHHLAFEAHTTLDTTSDPTLDIVIPDRFMHTVAVVDAAGAPLAGISISPIVTGPDLTLGTSQTWTTLARADAFASNPKTCTTGATGECQFRTFAPFLDPAHPGTVSLTSGQTASNHPSGNLGGSAVLTVPITTVTASTAQPESLVHGTIRDATGATVVGARVRTSDGSTAVSDAEGAYGVYVIAKPSVTVGAYASFDPTTSELSAPDPVTALADLSQPCSGLASTGPDGNQATCEVVGTTVRGPIDGDQQLDISLPAVGTRPVHVENAAGTAIADASVILNGGVQHVESTDPDGVVSQHLYSAGWVSTPWSTCVTDAAGDCSLRALSDSADAELSAWAFKGLTFGSGGTIAVDAYGTADHLISPVTTIRTAFWTNASQGANSGDVVVAATQPDPDHPSGRALSDVSIAPAPALPSGQVSPSGILSYTVSAVPIGGTQDVVIVLPEGSAPTAVYKDTASGLVDVTSIATIAGDTIVMHLTDGGFGDEDGIANGVIVDPVIPVRGTPTPQATITATLTRPVTTYGQRTVLKTTTLVDATGRRANGGTITVTEGSTTHGTCTVTRTGTCNIILPTVPAGTHTLTATYNGSPGTGSTTVNLAVWQANTKAIIRGPSSATTGSPVTFTARAWTLAPGRGIPTGTITFTDGAAILGTVPVDGTGYASLTTSALTFGGHTITATYNGSPNHTTSSKARTTAIK